MGSRYWWRLFVAVILSLLIVGIKPHMRWWETVIFLVIYVPVAIWWIEQ